MGHCVTGILAKPELLQAFAREHSLHQPVRLAQGFALLPLRDEDIDSFLQPPLSGYPPGFIYLSEQLARELRTASRDGAILYFETDYFGGAGTQGAAVFSEGEVVYGPRSAEIGPINEALAKLGVRVQPPAHDEFEAVGLHRHRSVDDWLEPYRA